MWYQVHQEMKRTLNTPHFSPITQGLMIMSFPVSWLYSVLCLSGHRWQLALCEAWPPSWFSFLQISRAGSHHTAQSPLWNSFRRSVCLHVSYWLPWKWQMICFSPNNLWEASHWVAIRARWLCLMAGAEECHSHRGHFTRSPWKHQNVVTLTNCSFNSDYFIYLCNMRVSVVAVLVQRSSWLCAGCGGGLRMYLWKTLFYSASCGQDQSLRSISFVVFICKHILYVCARESGCLVCVFLFYLDATLIEKGTKLMLFWFTIVAQTKSFHLPHLLWSGLLFSSGGG